MYQATFKQGYNVKFPVGTPLQRAFNMKPGEYVLLYDFFGVDPTVKTTKLIKAYDIDIYVPVLFLRKEETREGLPNKWHYLIPTKHLVTFTHNVHDFYRIPPGCSY